MLRVRVPDFEPNPKYFNENYTPELKNILYFSAAGIEYSSTRGAKEKVDEAKKRMRKYVKSQGATVIGEPIVQTRKVDHAYHKIWFDIYMPLDKPIKKCPSSNFIFKETITMEGCIMSRFQGYFDPLEDFFIEKVQNRDADYTPLT